MERRDRNIQDEQKKRFRKKLRRMPTKAEYVLWQELRRFGTGFKFRRQTSIGVFIVDFYCHSLRLVIEVDGPIHDTQKEYDLSRQQWLESRGYTIIRFTNDEVLFERETVMFRILEVCSSLPVHTR